MSSREEKAPPEPQSCCRNCRHAVAAGAPADRAGRSSARNGPGQTEQRPQVLGERALAERVAHDDPVELGAIVHVLAEHDAAAGLSRGRQEQRVEQAKSLLFDRRIGQIERVLIGCYDRKQSQPVTRLRQGLIARNQSLFSLLRTRTPPMPGRSECQAARWSGPRFRSPSDASDQPRGRLRR
jgi:hypothetical protein